MTERHPPEAKGRRTNLLGPEPIIPPWDPLGSSKADQTSAFPGAEAQKDNETSSPITARIDEALQRLSQYQSALDAYIGLHRQADQQMLQHLDRLLGQMRWVIAVSWVIRIAFVIVTGSVLGVSLYILWWRASLNSVQQLIGGGVALISLIALWMMATHDPTKAIRETLINLVKSNVIFLTYLRQMSQIDATFLQQIGTKPIKGAGLEEALDQLKTAMQGALLDIDELLNDEP